MHRSSPVSFPVILPASGFRFSAFRLAAPLFDSTTNPNPGNGNEPPNPPAPRTFTQAELDEILEERLARERSKISQKYKGIDPEDYERLKREETERKRKEAEEEKNYQAAIKSIEDGFAAKEKAWQEEREGLFGELRTERISNKLIAAAAAANAYDPSQIAKLLNDRVRLGDDRRPQVLDERGEPAFKEGKPLTVEQLVSDYLDRNPHLVKSSGTGGAGAGGGNSTSSEGKRNTREHPDLQKARDSYEAIRKRLEGKRGTPAELAELQKAKRLVDKLAREAARGK